MIKRENENLNLARLPIPPRGLAGMAGYILTVYSRQPFYWLRENPAFVIKFLRKRIEME